MIDSSSHHKANHLVYRNFTAVASDNHLTIAEDGNAVGQFENLLKMMRDIDNPDPVFLQLPNLEKQSLRVSNRQSCSWLIEYQHLASPGEPGGNLHQLLLANAKIIYK